MFLCTNSSFEYIDAGLRFMLGDGWQKVVEARGGLSHTRELTVDFWRVYRFDLQLFDVVMVSARKPQFYTRQRAFRMLDTERKQVQVWAS